MGPEGEHVHENVLHGIKMLNGAMLWLLLFLRRCEKMSAEFEEEIQKLVQMS